MVVLARVRTADHHDDELTVAEDALVAHRRLQHVTVLVDPAAEVEGLQPAPYMCPRSAIRVWYALIAVWRSRSHDEDSDSGALARCRRRAADSADCVQYMPWGKKPPQPPVPVNELVELAADGTPTHAFRSTGSATRSCVDLQGAATQRAARPEAARRREMAGALAFRVMPGSIGLLEVQADQRMLIPVTREGTQAVDLELVPGVYTAEDTADHASSGNLKARG